MTIEALHIVTDWMLNELAETSEIIEHYDTVGSLLLVAAAWPHPEIRISVIKRLAAIVIGKFGGGAFDKYVETMTRVVDVLDKRGLLDDTRISQTRAKGIPYHAPDLTIVEIYQNHINVWSLPRFLWEDERTFKRLVIELEYLLVTGGRPIIPLRNYDIFFFWTERNGSIHCDERWLEFHKRLHEGYNTCKSCTWCDPERWR